MTSDWIDTFRADDIDDDSCQLFDLEDEDVAIYNLRGTYYAIKDRCTHDGGDLASGWINNGCAVCPRHGARFDIKTGQVMAPPAYEDVHAFPTRVDNGIVQIRDDRD